MSELRRNLAQYLDEAMATGEALVVRRKRGRLVLRPETGASATPSRADRMRGYFKAGSDLLPETTTIEEARTAILALSTPSALPGERD